MVECFLSGGQFMSDDLDQFVNKHNSLFSTTFDFVLVTSVIHFHNWQIGLNYVFSRLKNLALIEFVICKVWRNNGEYEF